MSYNLFFGSLIPTMVGSKRYILATVLLLYAIFRGYRLKGLIKE